jgi:hypothetical protein
LYETKLLKNKAELIGFRIQGCNLVEREAKCSPFVLPGNAAIVLMKCISINLRFGDCSLFIDSSKLSLKAIFLVSRNYLPSISVVRAVHMGKIVNTELWVSCMHIMNTFEIFVEFLKL